MNHFSNHYNLKRKKTHLFLHRTKDSKNVNGQYGLSSVAAKALGLSEGAKAALG